MLARKAFSSFAARCLASAIALLAALLLPVVGRAKESARATACLSNLHQVGIALQIYVSENNNKLPVMRDVVPDPSVVATNVFPTIDKVLSPQLGNRNVLRCPSDLAHIFEITSSSYSWNSLLNGQDADHLEMFTNQLSSFQVNVVFDKEAFHKARGQVCELSLCRRPHQKYV